MDASSYDEFGNYIGPELASSSEEEEEENDYETEAAQVHADQDEVDEQSDQEGHSSGESGGYSELTAMARRMDIAQTQVVLHEDKKYYPDAEEVFGPGVEALVQEEDTQPLTEPIIAPIKVRKFQVDEEEGLPDTSYTKEFLVDLLGYPAMTRNLAVSGHLHHGKTALVDLLVASTHEWPEWDKAAPVATPTAKMPKPSERAFGYTD
ncbi:hypothetical protein GGI00_006812, partial [Coemansia sp. RSA 2681]